MDIRSIKSARPVAEVLSSTLDDVVPISVWWGWAPTHTWGIAAALGVAALQDAVDEALTEILPHGTASQRAKWYPAALERVRTGAPAGYIGTNPGWEINGTLWFHHGSKYLPITMARPRMTLPSAQVARDIAVVAAQCGVLETRAWGMAIDLGLHSMDERLRAEYPEYAAWRKQPKPAPPADLREVYGVLGFEYPLPPDSCPHSESNDNA